MFVVEDKKTHTHNGIETKCITWPHGNKFADISCIQPSLSCNHSFQYNIYSNENDLIFTIRANRIKGILHQMKCRRFSGCETSVWSNIWNSCRNGMKD